MVANACDSDTNEETEQAHSEMMDLMEAGTDNMSVETPIDSSNAMTMNQLFPIDPETGLRVPEHGPVPPLPEWPDNPVTEAKERLGLALFFDNRLSGSGNGGCPTCHANVDDYQSGVPLDIPDRSFPMLYPTLHRNAPSLLNIVYAPVFRWDGSHGTNLYEQMALPYAESNMNLTPGIPAEDFHTVDVPLAQVQLKQRLTEALPEYIEWYREAFSQDIRDVSLEEFWLMTGKALAIYIRRAVSRDSAFDRWNAGDDEAMGEDAIRGLILFRGKAGCSNCHRGALFSDFSFHNVSLSVPNEDGVRPDEGRFIVTGREQDRGAFLTPTLRSVTKTVPYFHDGSISSLKKAIQHFGSAEARKDPLHSPILDTLSELTNEETKDIIAFLKALSGSELPLEVTDPPPHSFFPNADIHPLSAGVPD